MTGRILDRYRYAPPLASQFPNLYDGATGVDPTLTDSDGSGLVMEFALTLSNNDFMIKAATKTKASGDHSIIARFNNPTLQGFVRSSIVMTDGTKFVLHSLGLCTDGSVGVQSDTFTNETTFNSSLIDNFKVHPMCEWLRVDIVSNTPKDFFYSINGRDWLKIYDTSQSGFITVTQVGIGMTFDRVSGGQYPINGTLQSVMNCLYFADGDIVPGF